MKTRGAWAAALLALGLTAVACGENLNAPPPGPTGPSSLSPLFLPRIDGTWGGSLILTGVAGGTGPARTAAAVECVGEAFGAVIGESNEHRLSITQSGTALSATLASATTGLACSYSGRVGSAGSFQLHAFSCEPNLLLFRCPPDSNGTVLVRQMQPIGSSITATFDPAVNVATISGTVANTYNLLDEKGEGGVGTVVVNHEFTNLTRR